MRASHRATQFLFVFASFAAACSFAFSQPPATPSNNAYETPTVTLSLIVTDPADRSFEGLTKDGIRLKDNGLPQNVLFFAKDNRVVDLGLAIDRSGSLHSQFLEVMDAAKSIIDSKRPEDRVFIESFVDSEKIEKVQNFTSRRSLLLDGLDSLYVEAGRSAVIDAIVLAAKYVGRSDGGAIRHRRAIVLITDGDDRDSFYSLVDLQKILLEGDVQFFVIGLVSEVSITPPEDERIRGYRTRKEAVDLLTEVARITGGRVFFPQSKAEMALAIAEISHNLQSQYLFGYRPDPPTRGYHTVKIEFSEAAEKLGLKAIAKPGYFGPGRRAK